MLHQKYFAKRTFVDNLFNCEILQGYLLFFVTFTFQKGYRLRARHVKSGTGDALLGI